MGEAYIVAIARTAGGRKGGRLKDWHPVDLGAAIIDNLVAQTKADPALIDDVIMGCVSQAGEQAMNVATLPGIVGPSLAMPDIHQGYGFPIGGVAATDYHHGVVSRGKSTVQLPLKPITHPERPRIAVTLRTSFQRVRGDCKLGFDKGRKSSQGGARGDCHSSAEYSPVLHHNE